MMFYFVINIGVPFFEEEILSSQINEEFPYKIKQVWKNYSKSAKIT